MNYSESKFMRLLIQKDYTDTIIDSESYQNIEPAEFPPFPMCWQVGSYPSKKQYIEFVLDWYNCNVDILDIYEKLFPDIANKYDDVENHADLFLKEAADHEYENRATIDMIFKELFSDTAYKNKKHCLKTVFQWDDQSIESEMKRTCDT